MKTQDSIVINNLTIGVTTVAFSKNEQLVNKLREVGFKEVIINEPQRRLTHEELIDFLVPCDIAILGLDKITHSVLSRTPKLKIISKYGVGLDNIDFGACRTNGVEVLASSGVNKRSVSELALGCMLSLCRNIYINANDLKTKKWTKNGGIQLTEKTVGIIGVGHVGKDLIELLRPFNCKILVNDILDQRAFYTQKSLIYSTKNEIYKQADIISIHTPLTDDLMHFINKRTLSMMKPNAIVINTARGNLINQDDLKWALQNKIIAGAAIDVYDQEPPLDMELIEIPNLITTPHIGGNSEEAVLAMGISAIENILLHLNLSDKKVFS